MVGHLIQVGGKNSRLCRDEPAHGKNNKWQASRCCDARNSEREAPKREARKKEGVEGYDEGKLAWRVGDGAEISLRLGTQRPAGGW